MTTLDTRTPELPFPAGPPPVPTTTIQGDPQAAARRRDANAAAHSPSLMLIMMLATLGAVAYAVFLLDPDHRGDWLPYALVITAECVLLGLALLAMWTVLSSGYNPRDFAYHHARDRMFDAPEILREGVADDPTRWRLYLHDRPVEVDVFVTTCGEDVDTIARTVRAAMAVHGSHRTWVLDDGRDDEVRDLAATLGARYVRRMSSGGQKAGNINHALSIAKGDLFVVLDADFVPKPDLLVEMVPFFVRDDVAFVQSPQTYGNMHTLISRGAGYMQAVFYRFVQPGRNRFNAAFCVGTNVMFRREAIDDIGGMCTDSKSEDVWTSLHLHERGWRSVYIPQTLAVGDTPETIVAYAKQQLRWATGGFEILLQHNPLSPRRKLTVDQRLQYFVTSTHYLSGIAPLLLLLVPPLQIYLDLAPMRLDVSVGTWLLYYLGFYGLQIALAFFTLGSFRWEVLLLSAVSWPIYVKAFWNALTGKQQAWSVTGRTGGATSPFEVIVPQVLCFVFLLVTSVVGVWKHGGDDGLPGLSVAWNITNTVILGGFLVTALREHRAAVREQRAARRPARAARRADVVPPTRRATRRDVVTTGGAA
ncbi:cellulose synthase (UDP-forming) [Isoptericola jiangsuensis]|uniref:Cellulose synthase (UDP-forming) n=1 Tax=Isoptericola jiangsuensis TaxID=548579 RepID=A0A2A9F058_9MICO|nr:cellulose synthase catalytic subunit [Isoptericola jiangsuensis]PFG44528.1 cellulose synthase (UDP-forming) [Isoptericola jiangsuensis]